MSRLSYGLVDGLGKQSMEISVDFAKLDFVQKAQCGYVTPKLQRCKMMCKKGFLLRQTQFAYKIPLQLVERIQMRLRGMKDRHGGLLQQAQHMGLVLLDDARRIIKSTSFENRLDFGSGLLADASGLVFHGQLRIHQDTK